MARLLFLCGKPKAAKASLDLRRRALRIASDAQALCRLAPASLIHLEHYAADLRARAEMAAQDQLRAERAN
jgi:hypothetical protein